MGTGGGCSRKMLKNNYDVTLEKIHVMQSYSKRVLNRTKYSGTDESIRL